MSTVAEIKHGLTRAWDALAEGWRDFTARAGDALTRFTPGSHEAAQHPATVAGNRWGVLAAQISVADDNVEVTLEVPGMENDDFSIDVHDDVLVIRGEKHCEKQRQDGRFYVTERAYGRFERALQLPVAVDNHSATAQYRRGVLRVTLPRAVHQRARRISIATN